MRSFSIEAIALILVLARGVAAAQDYSPYPQPDAGYVTDLADVLTPVQEERIEQSLIRVEARTKVEIIVVTVGSLSDYPGTANKSIDAFATALFNRWGIGNAPANDGILLLVSVRDRVARIELGAGYPAARDGDAAAIINASMVPSFRRGDYAGGIANGVKATVDEFAPSRFRLRWQTVAAPALVVALFLIGFSLLKNGKRGWGWVFVGMALVVLVAILYLVAAAARRRYGHSSGWRSGGLGGFGGGFSTGGGATGSW